MTKNSPFPKHLFEIQEYGKKKDESTTTKQHATWRTMIQVSHTTKEVFVNDRILFYRPRKSSNQIPKSRADETAGNNTVFFCHTKGRILLGEETRWMCGYSALFGPHHHGPSAQPPLVFVLG
jgi:hypothetical protein